MDLTPTITLPGADIVVPPLAVGTMYWGTDTDQAQTHALLDRAVERGATFLDTADNYAFWRDGGTGDESESVIGSWLSSRPRDSVTVATKVGARPVRAGADLGDVRGLRPDAVAKQLRESLRRLRTEHVDLVYAHVDDTAVPLSEVIGGLQQLVDDGLARGIAASNLTAPRLRQALRTPGYLGLQNRFTYLQPASGADLAPHVLLDDEVQAVAAQAGLALFGYSCLLGGAYTRADRPLPDGYRHAGTQDALAVLAEVAAEHDLDAGQAVLAWMGQRNQPVIPVVGVSRIDQLDSAVDAAATVLHRRRRDGSTGRGRPGEHPGDR